jgi:hypothetical protein
MTWSSISVPPRIQARVASALLVLASTSILLPGCARQHASPEECKAAIIHAMEVQLDSPDFHAAVGQAAADLPPEQLQESREWLKSQLPSLVTPTVVAQCVERMERKDAQCTMSAITTGELVDKCHWKVVAGPKGATLGF